MGEGVKLYTVGMCSIDGWRKGENRLTGPETGDVVGYRIPGMQRDENARTRFAMLAKFPAVQPETMGASREAPLR